MGSRGVVTLTLECTNACVFCGQHGLEPLPLALPARIDEELRELRARTDAVTFVGGEPGLVDGLDEWIAAAHALGFTRIGVQTNGHGFTHLSRLRALASAGLTDLHLSLLGADAPVHDYHTGQPHSFERVLQCFAAARSAGLEVVVNTVLTRSNFRTLDALALLVVARGAAAWCISVPLVAGRAETNFDRVVPRLGLALPFALRAIVLARTHGVASFVSGAPLCLLGPHGTYAIVSESRAYGAVCETCPARAACPGVDAIYLERFDGDEIAPRPSMVHVGVAPSAGWPSDAFTGVGEHAPRGALVAASSPARARRALPMLGRGVPAIAEVGRGEKRSGEALRTLFPALFEKESTPPDDDESGGSSG